MRQAGEVFRHAFPTGQGHIVARGTHRASVMANRHWTQRGLCGVNIFGIPDGRSSSGSGPSGPLDVAPDRRLVDLELGGADRPAGAQCAEFGQ
jgi:hypothetical protein